METRYYPFLIKNAKIEIYLTYFINSCKRILHTIITDSNTKMVSKSLNYSHFTAIIDDTADIAFMDPRYISSKNCAAPTDSDDQKDFFEESGNMGGNVDYDLINEDGTYTETNEMNGYEDDHDNDECGVDNDYYGYQGDKHVRFYDDPVSQDEDDIVSDNSDNTSYEDPDVVLEREKKFGNLFRKNLAKKEQHDSQFNKNLNFAQSRQDNKVSSRTHTENTFIMNDQQHGKAKLNELISDYLSQHPFSDTFVIKGVMIDELPEIMKTMTCIKDMTVTQCGLKTLANLPPNIVKLDVRYNDLKKLISSELPNTITEINANKNEIQMIDLSKSTRIKTLNVSNNPLSGSLLFPPNCEEVHAASSNLCSTKCFSDLKNLAILKINLSSVESIDDLPDSVVDISASRTMIGYNRDTNGTISRLPKSLMKFVCHTSGIKGFTFQSFPPNLSHIDLYDNDLQTVPTLPEVMSYVDISKNKLVCVSNVPSKVQNYQCDSNPMIKFTSDQMKIVEELKRDIEVSIVLNSDEEQDIFFGSDGLEKMGYNTRSNGQRQSYMHNGVDKDVYDMFTSSNRYDVDQSVGSRVMLRSVTGQGQYQEYNSNHTSVSTVQQSEQSSVQSSEQTTNQQELQRPLMNKHIMRLLGSDEFVPTKDSARRIRHEHVYYV